jgi:hypothetical protein
MIVSTLIIKAIQSCICCGDEIVHDYDANIRTGICLSDAMEASRNDLELDAERAGWVSGYCNHCQQSEHVRSEHRSQDYIED